MKVSPPPDGKRLRLRWALGCVGLCVLATAQGKSVGLEEARPLFPKGNYAECIRVCDEAIAQRETSEEWRLLLAQSLLAVGRYTDASSVIRTNLERYPWSVRLRLLGHQVFRQNGQADQASRLLNEINDLGSYRMWAYQDAP